MLQQKPMLRVDTGPWFKEKDSQSRFGSLSPVSTSSTSTSSSPRFMDPYSLRSMHLHGTKAVETHRPPARILNRSSSVPSGIGEVKMNDVLLPPVSSKSHLAPLEKTPIASMEYTPAREIPCNFGQHNVPEALKELNYWSALDIFDVADPLQQGFLGKVTFFNLLSCVTRGDITRLHSDRLFDELDFDQSGRIDKADFLGWTFGTHSLYFSALRRRLAHLQEHAVMRLCHSISAPGNASLDKHQFRELMSKAEKTMTREVVDLLFGFIAGKGKLDIGKLFAWIHPERRGSCTRVVRPAHGPSDPLSPVSPTSHSNMNAMNASPLRSLLFETPANEPVILEFTIGPKFHTSLAGIKKILYDQFGYSHVAVRTVTDPSIGNTCDRLIVKLGRGILLWDRPSMVRFRDDPFSDDGKAKEWIFAVLAENMPIDFKPQRKTRRHSAHPIVSA